MSTDLNSDQGIASLLLKSDERALTELARRFRGLVLSSLEELAEEEREAALQGALVRAWNRRSEAAERALAPWFFSLVVEVSACESLRSRLPEDSAWAGFEDGLDDGMPDDAAVRRSVASVLKDPKLVRSAPEPSIAVAPNSTPRPAPGSANGLLVLVLIVGLINLALLVFRQPEAPALAPVARLGGTDFRITCELDQESVSVKVWLDEDEGSPRLERSGPIAAESAYIKQSELGEGKHRLRYRLSRLLPTGGPELAALPWRALIVVEQRLSGAAVVDEESWLPLNNLEFSAAVSTPTRIEKQGGTERAIYEGVLVLADE